MIYRALPDKDASRARIRPAPKGTGELLALGYKLLGLLETASGAQEQVSEIYASPDGRTFAEPEGTGKGKELLYLRSILHDGTIVDTAGPPWLPAWLIPPPRRHAPAAGYHLQRMKGSTREKHDAHRALLSRVEAERRTTAAPADSVERMAELCHRSAAVSRVHNFVWVVMLVAVVAASALAVQAGALSELGRWRQLVGTVGPLLGMGAVNAVSNLLGGSLARMKTVPLAELEAAHV